MALSDSLAALVRPKRGYVRLGPVAPAGVTPPGGEPAPNANADLDGNGIPETYVPPPPPPVDARTFTFVDPEKVGDAAKWAAGGFTLLAALLTFLGIEAGLLDRLLRAEEDRALLVFLLVGIGVVASLLAPAFQQDVLIPVPLVCVVIALLGVAASVLGWEGWDALWTLRGLVAVAGFALVVVVAVAARDRFTSLVAASLVLGIVATAMGLYAAATLAIESKQARDAPSVTAVLEQTDAGQVIKADVAATRREEEQLVVVARGHDSPAADEGSVVGRAVLTADGAGDITASLTFPVTAGQWSALSVGYCAAVTAKDKCGVAETVRFRPDRGSARVSVELAPANGAVTAKVTASDIAPGTFVRVRVLRGRQEYVKRIAGNADGREVWTVRVPRVRRGDVVVVRYAVCVPKCGARVEERYRVR